MKTFIKITLTIIMIVFGFSVAKAQVAINTNGANPDISAMLDVASTTKGLLIPRMSEIQRNAISSPVAGLMIYQTDSIPGYYFYNGTNWDVMGSESISIDNLTDGKTSINCVFLGSGAGINDNGGSYNNNVAIGIDALNTNTSGYYNTATGYQALFLNTTGMCNTANGNYALFSNTTGSFNTATGNQSLHNNTTGEANTAIGHSALYGNTTGIYNTAIGPSALVKNTTGRHNIAIGLNTLLQNTTGSYNTVIGTFALTNNTGQFNTAIGNQTLFSNTTGDHNTANGNFALYYNTEGNYNTANGSEALNSNTTGYHNTAIGYQALKSNTTGYHNTAIGYKSNYYNEEGSYNTIIGYEAGMGTVLHSKTGNVFLGYQAGYYDTTNNKLYIENSDALFPLIYGDFYNDVVTLNANLGIGTSSFGSGTRTLALINGTAPTVSITDGVLLYSEDVSASSELKVRDEAGNVTTLSPHNFSMTNKSEPMAWSFYSENPGIGKKINVDMLRVVRLVEKITGEKLAYVKNIEDGSDNINIEENTIGIIQQQQTQIEQQQKMIEELQRQNSELMKRIGKLEER